MKKLRTFWFNTLNECFGIVVGEDDVTGKRKAYCGVVPGNDEEADEARIMRTGSPIDPRLLREALNLLEPTEAAVKTAAGEPSAEEAIFRKLAAWLMGRYLVKTGDHYKIEKEHTQRMRNG